MYNIIVPHLISFCCSCRAFMDEELVLERELVSLNDQLGYWSWTIDENAFLVGWCCSTDELGPQPDSQPTMKYGIKSVTSKKSIPDPEQPLQTGKKKPKTELIKEVMVFKSMAGDTITVRLATFIIVESGAHRTLPALAKSYATKTPLTASTMKSMSPTHIASCLFSALFLIAAHLELLLPCIARLLPIISLKVTPSIEFAFECFAYICIFSCSFLST